MIPKEPALVQLQKIKILQSAVSILWSHYSFEAAKLEHWASGPAGAAYVADAKTARYFETRFKSTLDQLNDERDELFWLTFSEWEDKADELSKKLNEATKDVNEHYLSIESTAKAGKTAAQALASILDVLKFLALIP